MSKIDWQDVADRAAWTFAQAGLAVLAASSTGFVGVGIWKQAAIAGGAAVISFLKNIAVQANSAA